MRKRNLTAAGIALVSALTLSALALLLLVRPRQGHGEVIATTP